MIDIADGVTDDVVDGGRFIALTFKFKLAEANDSVNVVAVVDIGVTAVDIAVVIPALDTGGADGGRIIKDVLPSLIVFGAIGETGAKCDDDVGDLLISDALALLLLLFEDGCEKGIGDGNGDAIDIFVGVAGFENENGLSRKSRTNAVFID